MTGWGSTWAHDILSQLGSTIKRVSSPTFTNGYLISKIRSKSVRRKTKWEKQKAKSNYIALGYISPMCIGVHAGDQQRCHVAKERNSGTPAANHLYTAFSQLLLIKIILQIPQNGQYVSPYTVDEMTFCVGFV